MNIIDFSQEFPTENIRFLENYVCRFKLNSFWTGMAYDQSLQHFLPKEWKLTADEIAVFRLIYPDANYLYAVEEKAEIVMSQLKRLQQLKIFT